MKLYFAPMEGIVTATYRKVYRKHFKGVDRFYTPFLAANQNHKFRRREKQEYIPYMPDTVPQVLTSSAEDFLWAAGVLSDAGYEEVNINMGCPSATVVTKKRGAGMLADKQRLDEFFYEIFSSDPESELPAVSVKTRIGMESRDEVYELIDIWKKYPLKEIIVHPRVRSDFYENEPDMEAFEAICSAFSRGADNTFVTYNGDVRNIEDVTGLKERFGDDLNIMIGRGLLIDPALAERIKGLDDTTEFNKRLRDFLTDLWDEYEQVLDSERDILFKMKELWSWLGLNFPESDRELKTIRKTVKKSEYMAAVREICS